LTVIRYPFSDEFEHDEDAWEAPDALGISGTEAIAANHRREGFVRSLVIMRLAAACAVLFVAFVAAIG
jgi:hypothetical protein